MKIEIPRWQPLEHRGHGIASVNFRIGRITVRAALFHHYDGGYRVSMPLTQLKQRNGRPLVAVGLSDGLWEEVCEEALRYYESTGNRRMDELRGDAESSEPDNAGLKRVLAA